MITNTCTDTQIHIPLFKYHICISNLTLMLHLADELVMESIGHVHCMSTAAGLLSWRSINEQKYINLLNQSPTQMTLIHFQQPFFPTGNFYLNKAVTNGWVTFIATSNFLIQFIYSDSKNTTTCYSFSWTIMLIVTSPYLWQMYSVLMFRLPARPVNAFLVPAVLNLSKNSFAFLCHTNHNYSYIYKICTWSFKLTDIDVKVL